MVAGVFLIAFGVLVAIYPHLLVAMVSTICILLGLGMCAVSWQWRSARRRSQGSFFKWMARF